jgi:hypothetical protein
LKPANPFAELRQPENLDEWQVVADLSNLLLTLDIAGRFGLFERRIKVNRKRCEDLLAVAYSKGISPRTLGPVPNLTDER